MKARYKNILNGVGHGEECAIAAISVVLFLLLREHKLQKEECLGHIAGVMLWFNPS